MKKNNIGLAVVLILGPFIGLAAASGSYMLMKLITDNLGDNSPAVMMTESLVNIILGLVALVSILGIFIAIPIGLILLVISILPAGPTTPARPQLL